MCFFSAKREKVRQRGGKNLGETRSLKVVELVLIKNLIKIVKHVSAGLAFWNVRRLSNARINL